MPKGKYEVFEALNPFFEVVMEGLRGLVDGDHYFDTIGEDAFFEFPVTVIIAWDTELNEHLPRLFP